MHWKWRYSVGKFEKPHKLRIGIGDSVGKIEKLGDTA